MPGQTWERCFSSKGKGRFNVRAPSQTKQLAVSGGAGGVASESTGRDFGSRRSAAYLDASLKKCGEETTSKVLLGEFAVRQLQNVLS